MARTIKNLQLDGGCFVFDFINTVSSRKDDANFDYLRTFQDLLEWSAKVGLIRSKRLQVLRDLSLKRKKQVSDVFREIIDARENLYRLFSSIAAGAVPDAAITNSFNKRMSSVFNQLEMRIGRTGAELDLKKDTVSVEEPLIQIMLNAFDILKQQDFQRIKECPRCGWIFLDTSKNGKRRWCDMNVCGSREKSLEYYYRKTKT